MKRSHSAITILEEETTTTTLLSIPNDVLRLIFKEILGGEKRARWGMLATMRLVCRRFRRIFPRTLLRAALEDDFAEFVSYCVCEHSMNTHYQHYYVLSNYTGAKRYHMSYSKDSFRAPPCPDKDAHPLLMCDTITRFGYQRADDMWWIPVAGVLQAWQKQLYATLLQFQLQNVDKMYPGQQSRFWYGVGSTYHTYFRGIAK